MGRPLTFGETVLFSSSRGKQISLAERIALLAPGAKRLALRLGSALPEIVFATCSRCGSSFPLWRLHSEKHSQVGHGIDLDPARHLTEGGALGLFGSCKRSTLSSTVSSIGIQFCSWLFQRTGAAPGSLLLLS